MTQVKVVIPLFKSHIRSSIVKKKDHKTYDFGASHDQAEQ